ncbi:MAG: hypothetical protein M3Y50_14060 [Acidobacteriota bacterium]|nr:hypothetical protein [Acidobacteriota bacterium]
MRVLQSVVLIVLFVFTGASFASGRSGEVESQTPVMSAAKAKGTATPAERARFAGSYRYAGSAEEEEGRRAAIDRAVKSTFFAIRSAARSRISATTQILPSYSFSFEAGKIRVQASSRPEMVSPENGEPADYAFKGMRSKFTQRFAGGRLTQVFVSESGTRENEFTLSEDGKVLTLKVTLTSPRLPKGVVYSLSYKKSS